MTLGLLACGVIVLILCRVPVAFAFLFPSLVYLVVSPGLTIETALQRVIAGIDSFILLAVPLFILVGNLMNVSGITDRIFNFVQSLLGHVRGSLGYVNVVASIIFSGMSGSAVADAAGLGSVEIAAMRKRGYDMPFAIGITGASSVIGPIIPPSIVAVVYGATAGVSIGALFLAGVLPGLLMGLMLTVMVYFYTKRRDYPSLERASLGEVGRATIKAFPALMTPVILLGGIFTGVFTPTESAGVAAIYAAVLGIGLYRALTLKGLYRSLVSTAETTASVLLIVGAASLFGWILTREQAPQKLYEVVVGLTDNTFVFLLLVNLLLLFMGMVLEPIPNILILVPILLPVVETFGIDPLHFGIVAIVNLTIGMLTPPVGNILYALNSVTDVPFTRVVSGTVPFLIPLIVALLLITFIPSIPLFLPRVFGFF